MDVSGFENVRKSAVRKRFAYLIGVALAGAVMALMGAMPNHSPSPAYQDDEPDTGLAIEHRLQRLEQNDTKHWEADARNAEAIQSIKEDTHYMRDRLDRFIDSRKGSR